MKKPKRTITHLRSPSSQRLKVAFQTSFTTIPLPLVCTGEGIFFSSLAWCLLLLFSSGRSNLYGCSRGGHRGERDSLWRAKGNVWTLLSPSSVPVLCEVLHILLSGKSHDHTHYYRHFTGEKTKFQEGTDLLSGCAAMSCEDYLNSGALGPRAFRERSFPHAVLSSESTLSPCAFKCLCVMN